MSDLTLEKFTELALPFLQSTGALELDRTEIKRVLSLIKEKVKTFAEVPTAVGYFFTDPKECRPGKLVFNRTVALKDSFSKAKA